MHRNGRAPEATTLRELQATLGGEIRGDPDASITGVASLEAAGQGDLAFAEHPRYRDQVSASAASAVVVGEDFPDLPGTTLLRLAKPREAFVRVVRRFHPPRRPAPGIHPRAVVSERARIGEDVSIGACAVVEANAQLGGRCVVEAGAYIGNDAALGEDCHIGPNVTLAHGVRLADRVAVHAGSVIGAEGFGYVWTGDRHMKVPQLGSVHIDDDVEIGANVCVDRATFGVTRVRRGAKIDNLCQIAHNNDIGEDAILVSQVGLSGSVTVGRGAILGGKVGVTGHVSIGAGAHVGGATAVTKSVKPGEVVWGYPVRPMKQVLRELAALTRLPALVGEIKSVVSRLAAVERRLQALEKQR